MIEPEPEPKPEPEPEPETEKVTTRTARASSQLKTVTFMIFFKVCKYKFFSNDYKQEQYDHIQNYSYLMY